MSVVEHEEDFNEKREEEYPSIQEQLDAIWAGGLEEQAMKAIMDGIKNKFPDPNPPSP